MGSQLPADHKLRPEIMLPEAVVKPPIASNNDKKSLTPEIRFSAEIARARGLDGGLAYHTDGSLLHEWTGMHWSPIDPVALEASAWRWLETNAPDQATPRLAASCAQAAVLAASPLTQPAGGCVVIPVRNGALDVSQDDDGRYGVQLRPSSREDGLTYVLACEYTPGAPAPRFAQFLEQVQPDPEVRGYLQEYAGYTLLPDCRFQVAQFWLGAGANGKSTLAEIISALHSRTTSMSLDRLDGFQLTGLIGASLVYVDETPARVDEQRLKTLISGGLMLVDRKYRDPLTLRPTAKWIVLGNQLPAISDQTHGFWRRLKVVPFNTRFSDMEQDPLLAGHIIKNELGGVLNWALEGLLRLLERGRFAQPPQLVLEAIEGGKRESNSVLAWWSSTDEHEVADEIETPKGDVYTVYHDWCRRNGMTPLASPRFWRRMHELEQFSDRQVTTAARGRIRVVGLQLSADERRAAGW